MALRKPLVLVSGEVQQLQAGDTLDASAANPEVLQATNDNVGAITEGMPVYPSGADSVDKAQADASGTAQPTGLVKDASIAGAASGAIQTDGPLDIADWTAVVGAALLVTGSTYFLSAATPGQLISTAPTAVGQLVTKVGRALSTTTLLVDIEQSILL